MLKVILSFYLSRILFVYVFNVRHALEIETFIDSQKSSSHGRHK